MDQEAFQLAASSAAELVDYLCNTKGATSSSERYNKVFGLNPAEFSAQLATYRHSQSDGATTPEAEAALRFITDALRVVMTVTESGVAIERAIVWFRQDPLPAFGGRTAEQLVSHGQVERLLQFLASWQAGSQG
ncbi:hypothetical protein ACF8LF_27755 [Pseudomonas putida]|uniref:hypothetical protein n=1 Tax=Pseudomonas TaxID=286 RepID=UPI0008119214|nr:MULTISPECIES: hypothetical protein [Pseudomonas]ELL4387345.1 hypothetical protein [Pseudomonas aeruginosa]MBX6205340.1 hypothetical protein [Pseudomonas aeruginosa]MCK1867769.1 hypothetical protein [Pseudomonas aeruginosa]MCK1877351.1 hypothetical protein [Pseudomonas aeruginosa]MCK1885211.1 hypothetical protein [Pseudomonas aeruginosa]